MFINYNFIENKIILSIKFNIYNIIYFILLNDYFIFIFFLEIIKNY